MHHNRSPRCSRSLLFLRSSFVAKYLFTLILLALLPAGRALADEPTAEQLKFFETRIRPLLVERCYECHSGDPDEVESKFQIDSRAGILRGGIHGPAAIAGMPEKSLMAGSAELRWLCQDASPKSSQKY